MLQDQVLPIVALDLALLADRKKVSAKSRSSVLGKNSNCRSPDSRWRTNLPPRFKAMEESGGRGYKLYVGFKGRRKMVI
jgi:hypothetical protein